MRRLCPEFPLTARALAAAMQESVAVWKVPTVRGQVRPSPTWGFGLEGHTGSERDGVR